MPIHTKRYIFKTTKKNNHAHESFFVGRSIFGLDLVDDLDELGFNFVLLVGSNQVPFPLVFKFWLCFAVRVASNEFAGGG